MKPELRPLVRILSLRRVQLDETSVHSGSVGDVEIVATMTGIGTRAATEASERLLSSMPVDHVVVVGIAGGVGPSVEIGDVIVPAAVIDGYTAKEYHPSPFGDMAPGGKVWTSDELLTEIDVVARLVEQGVVALDMETAAVAAVCEEHHCPWSVFRGISDRAGDELVDQAVFGLARPDGSANIPALARYLLPKPWRVRRLARLANDMKVAAEAAANAAVRACGQQEFGHQSSS
jgi:adenosylhomocysteine nucleosidase